jgi:type II secretory pathway component PulL
MDAARLKELPAQLWRRLALLALLILVAFVAWSVWGAYQKATQSAALAREAQASAADLAAQQATLEDHVAQLQSDRGKETALRQQYAVGKAGEQMVVIVNASSTPPPPSPTFFEKLKGAFSWW